MKQVASLGLMLLTCMSFAQVKLRITVGAEARGIASITQKLNPDGGKSVELKMELPNKLTVRALNSYDKQGDPLRKFLETIIPGGKLQRQVVATFDAEGANLVTLDGSNRKTRQIVLVSTAPRNNPSEFWFLRDKPKVGDQVKTYVFNMDAQAWELVTVTYTGVKDIKIGGKGVKAHCVETLGDRPSIAYLDDRGLPWKIEAGPMTMTRITE